MVHNHLKIIGLMALCTLFAATVQVLFKIVTKESITIFSFFNHIYLYLGFLLYFLAASLYILSLRENDVSIVYPMMSLSFVWTVIFSFFLLHEVISVWRITGIILIFAGVSLLGFGVKK